MTGQERLERATDVPPACAETMDVLLGHGPEHDRDSDETRLFLRAVAHAPPVDPLLTNVGAGHKIGRYRVVRELGRGAMGAILEAEDELLDRRVALKVHPSGPAATQAERQRWIIEAQAAASARHPGLPVVYDVGESDGRVFIAMELVQGESLRRRLASAAFGKLPVRESLRITAQLARALFAVHEAGFVHRDIKPENVMLEPSGRVKLVDFGLATRACAFSGKTSRGRRFAGTAGYAAPEQSRGDSVDGRADLFAMGTVLHELITGERPGLDLEARLFDAASHDRVPTEEACALVSLVRRCRAERPEERHPSAERLAAHLEALRVQVRRACRSVAPPDARARAHDPLHLE